MRFSCGCVQLLSLACWARLASGARGTALGLGRTEGGARVTPSPLMSLLSWVVVRCTTAAQHEESNSRLPYPSSAAHSAELGLHQERMGQLWGQQASPQHAGHAFFINSDRFRCSVTVQLNTRTNYMLSSVHDTFHCGSIVQSFVTLAALSIRIQLCCTTVAL